MNERGDLDFTGKFRKRWEPLSICSPEEANLQFSRSVMPDSLWTHRLQHARLPCPSPTPGACSDSYPLSQWCHPIISSSVIPFCSHLQLFPASGSFPSESVLHIRWPNIGVSPSASVLPNIWDWFPLGLTGLISLLSKGLSRIFSNTTVQNINSSVLSFLYISALIILFWFFLLYLLPNLQI